MKLRLLLLSAWLVLPGCQNTGLPEVSLPTITMPRIEFGNDQKPTLPVSVAYAFDASVTEARLETQACGLPYILNTGEMIPQAFLSVGRQRFQSVSAYEGSGEAVRTAQANDFTIQIGLVNHSLQAVDRIAEEENYLVFLNMQLQAVFLDRDGTELAKTPLRFNEQMAVWTPALTGQSVSCVTGQYDEAVRSAAHDLAGQLASVVSELLTTNSPQPPAAASQPTAPAAMPLTFRTRLKDANNNLILEAGETIVLEIETTYTGAHPLMAAHADLTGSDVIVEAFSTITTLPVSLGTFQPGEVKTTEIRGRLPRTVREPTGELVIALTPAGASAPVGSHRILVPLRAGSPAPQATDTPAAAHAPPVIKETRAPGEAYVAVLIGMDAYRDDWPNAYHIPTGRMKTVRERLQAVGTFTEPNMRILEGRHAAKSDIEEALFTWGRQRIGAESVLLVYFSGQAVKNPATGEVYLVPHEGSPDASANRLISLRTLQRALGTFDNRLTLLLLDAPLIPLSNPARGPVANESRPVRWDGGLPQDHASLVQIRHVPEPGNSDPAGVFAGLVGGADDKHAITVGEFLEVAARASEVTHMLPTSSPMLNIPLARETTAKPVGTVELAQPTESTGSGEPAETETAAKPVGTVETAQPTEPAKSGEPAETETAAKPVGTVEPAKPTEPTGSGEPAETETAAKPVGTVKLAKPTESAKSGEPAETETAAKPVGTVEAAEPTEPAGSGEPAETETAAKPIPTL